MFKAFNHNWILKRVIGASCVRLCLSPRDLRLSHKANIINHRVNTNESCHMNIALASENTHRAAHFMTLSFQFLSTRALTSFSQTLRVRFTRLKNLEDLAYSMKKCRLSDQNTSLKNALKFREALFILALRLINNQTSV